MCTMFPSSQARREFHLGLLALYYVVICYYVYFNVCQWSSLTLPGWSERAQLSRFLCYFFILCNFNVDTEIKMIE